MRYQTLGVLFATAFLCSLFPTHVVGEGLHNKVLRPSDGGQIQQWVSRGAICENRACDALGCACSNTYGFREGLYGSSVWLVYLCTSWADKCTKFDSTMASVAEALDGVIKVAVLDAEIFAKVAAEIGATNSYPALLGFSKGLDSLPIRYDGQRTASKISSWALSLLSAPVHLLQSPGELFSVAMGSGLAKPGVVLLYFTEKDRTPASLKAVAQEFGRILYFAEVRLGAVEEGSSNTTKHSLWGRNISALVSALRVREWPTVVSLAPPEIGVQTLPGWAPLDGPQASPLPLRSDLAVELNPLRSYLRGQTLLPNRSTVGTKRVQAISPQALRIYVQRLMANSDLEDSKTDWQLRATDSNDKWNHFVQESTYWNQNSDKRKHISNSHVNTEGLKTKPTTSKSKVIKKQRTNARESGYSWWSGPYDRQCPLPNKCGQKEFVQTRSVECLRDLDSTLVEDRLCGGKMPMRTHTCPATRPCTEGQRTCADEGPWQCIAKIGVKQANLAKEGKGCPGSLEWVDCALLKAHGLCNEYFNPTVLGVQRGSKIRADRTRLIRDACALSCGLCTPGQLLENPSTSMPKSDSERATKTKDEL